MTYEAYFFVLVSNLSVSMFLRVISCTVQIIGDWCQVIKWSIVTTETTGLPTLTERKTAPIKDTE